jgi:RNA polymerase sigma factor (sigma-70 family)
MPATIEVSTREASLNGAERRLLFSLHHEAIRRFARRLVPRSAAEDLVQDVAVLLLSHRTGPPSRECFVGWCALVAQHLAAHRRRSQARSSSCYERLSDLPVQTTLARSYGDPENTAATRERLAAQLERLDSDAAQLLRDRFALGETAAEIAARLNVSAASVRMRVARLVGTLRTLDDKSSEDASGAGYVRAPCGKS